MDNQDQRRTHIHTQGHESHGVHACHKCGWPFPNPHPSTKQRRAHKKICGTIQGYKQLVSDCQTSSNASVDKHLSDEDPYTHGPNSLDTGNNEKHNGGTEEILTRSGDEVFLDAIANFSDGALSPGNKEPLRDSLDSATDVEIVNIKYQEFSGSSDFNDVCQLIVKSTDDGQMQDPNILQSERVEDGNMLELLGQQLGSLVDPLSSSITDMRTVVHSDDNDYFGLSSDSNPIKAEATTDMLLENKIYAGENVTHCSLTSVAKETNLEENDEIKSDCDMFDIVVSSDNAVDDTCEGMLKIEVSDVVNLDCQVTGGAFNLEEKNNVEFLFVRPQDETSLEVNSILCTNTSSNGFKVESAHMIQFTTSGDVKTLQDTGEGNVNVFTRPSCDDRADVAHLQNECADFKDSKRVLPQNSLSLPSSEAWKPKQDDLKDSDVEENIFLINQSQLSVKREVLLPVGRVLDSSMKEQESCELVVVDEEIHAEESIDVSSVKFMIENDKGSDEIGASMNGMKIGMNENYMIHFSEERGSDDARKHSQQISLPHSSFAAASKENPSDISFGGSTNETTSAISLDNISHHEKYIKEINFIAVDGKCKGANVENDIEISLKTVQLSNLHLEVKPSSGVYKSDDVVKMVKFEKCDITDARYIERPIVKDSSLPKPAGSNSECPILSSVVMDMSARTLKGIECANKSPLSGVQEDIKDDEINSSCRLNKECNGFISTSADSHQTRDAELLVKAAEDLGRNYSSLYSLNVEPSAQCVSVAEDTQGEHGREVSGITVVPVQDQSGNNKVQLPSSSAIYTSIDYGIQCDSLEGNQGSVSGLPSTDLVVSTEAGKSNLKDPEAASETERQQCETSEMFEPPSFMTLVEPGLVVAASDVQNGLNQHPSSGWFPTLTQVTNESQGRKRNEEIIAKITNYRTSKQHTPLQSPVGEAAHSNKPESPKSEEKSMIHKNSESPAAKSVKGGSGKDWKSPADMKRQNKKVKSKSYWIPFVCCSSVNSPRR